MKKRILLLVMVLLLVVAGTCSAMPATDKVAHAGSGYMLNDLLKQTTKLSFLERTALIYGIAYAKERFIDKHIDYGDINATVGGALLVEVKF